MYSKYISSVLSLIGLLLMCGCAVDHPAVSDEHHDLVAEGTPFEVSFGGFADGMSVNALRADGTDNPDQIVDMRLLIFDENHRFLYSRKAVLGGIIADNQPDANHLPDKKKDNIKMMKRFTTGLISSNRKRYIHFIANHDWNGFAQDYFIEGVTDGELIGGMLTEKTEFWRMVEFDRLDKNSLENKVIKLLRNNAKVSVRMDNNLTNFKFQGFTVYNASNKATVAPFVFKEDLTYTFPTTPDVATIPSDVVPLTPKPFAIYDNGYDLFEKVNVSSEKPVFVIMKGQLDGKRVGYYKLDLVKVDPKTGETSYYDIIRNYHYRIVVSHVANEGYERLEDAVRNPAGNNLFASVELADYSSVSDGSNTLDVENLDVTYVTAPTTYSSRVLYTAGISNVQYYPSWNQDSDEYLGELTRHNGPEVNGGSISVPVKKVPADRVLEYFINVVARDLGGNVITRKIKIALRSPYDFKQQIVSSGGNTGSEVTISFEVPKTMTKSSVPFDVFIKTKELTPDLSQGKNDGMMLVLKDGNYYYRYRVRDTSQIGTRVDLHFKRNQSRRSETIELTSMYYNKASVVLQAR